MSRADCQRGLFERQGALGKTIAKRFAFQIFHDDEIAGVMPPDIEHNANVRMIQTRGRSRLAFESFACVGTQCKVIRQDFDSYGPSQACVARSCRLLPFPRRRPQPEFRMVQV
jgi:hypothetical protein